MLLTVTFSTFTLRVYLQKHESVINLFKSHFSYIKNADNWKIALFILILPRLAFDFLFSLLANKAFDFFYSVLLSFSSFENSVKEVKEFFVKELLLIIIFLLLALLLLFLFSLLRSMFGIFIYGWALRCLKKMKFATS